MNLKLPTKHYSIPLPAMDCVQDFEQFARALNGEVIGKDIVQLSGGLAKGMVKKRQIQPGCCLRSWNLVFNHPVELQKCGEDPDSKRFTIVYVLTPGSCRLKSIGGHEQFSQIETRNTLMVANDVALKFDIAPHRAVQVIEISATSFWLAQQFQRAGLPLDNFLDRVNEKGNPLILNCTCPPSVINRVNMLFDHLMGVEEDYADADQLATSLILDFLHKMLNSQVPRVAGSQDAHFLKVMEAEAILQAHLQRNLPNVCAIAQQVSLSESTLKRHFKIIFGKSLYEYYLEKKMNLAKVMLLEKPLTVYQTASMLGYEKVSNFIGIFKKHHGYSPGSMKKKGFMNQ
ncbi:MAG: helix-turn-helix transcriptional regulator [Niastella sp.]|nr:helix-turn-helix transcriptional regulator [Niastella sp.]